MPSTTGAGLLVRCLKATGVDVIFTLSGNQILPIYDACLDAGVRLVDARHESAAAHMADAYARLTGRPAVCLVTAGPGHTNALTGIGTALLAESPVLFLSGGSELARAGQGAFQELDQPALAAPLTKLSLCVESADELPALIARAWREMLGCRPGPVHVTLPADVLTDSLEAPLALPAAEDLEPLWRAADPRAIEEATALLAKAERPLVLGGPAMAWGTLGRAFGEFLELTGLPGFVLESPRGLTDPALHGLGQKFRQADVVLLLAPQDYAIGFAAQKAIAEQGRLIEVAPEAGDLGRNREPAIGLVGHSASILRQLGASLVHRSPLSDGVRSWRQSLDECRAAGRASLTQAERSDQQPLHPLRLCEEVANRLGPGDVVTIDGGEFAQWARWAFGGRQQRVVLNGKLGMIGCAIPFALAARIAAPDSRVVAFLGDGTFGFHGFELDTAVRHNLPFVAIVGHDAGWSAERHRQVAVYGRDRLVASELLETRYDRVAQALGAKGELVEDPADLGPALDRALASDRPTVLNVRIASLPSPAAPAG